MPTTPTKRFSTRRRPSHSDMFAEVLRHAPGHRLSRSDSLKQFNERWTPWKPRKFYNKLAQILQDENCPIDAAKGPGEMIRFTGGESGGGGAGSGLHNPVATLLRFHGVRGFRGTGRHVEVTANRRVSSRAVWSTPDIVMTAPVPGHPESILVTFEVVEPHEGCDIRSVYQAHAQGTGADFSWVLFDRGTRTQWPHETDKRLIETANELGIGLISLTKPSVESMWTVERRAVRRPRDSRAARAGRCTIENLISRDSHGDQVKEEEE
jgi:hypothetical protein